jgi:isopenicillin N synthase-like dioxygenase
VPGYRKTTEEYLDALMVLSGRLNRLLALALGLAPDYFDDKFTTPLVSLRPLHYNESVSNPTEVSSDVCCAMTCLREHREYMCA